MENNLKFEIIPLKDFFGSEDVANNFLIDMWVAEQEYEKQHKANIDKPISAIGGKTVTITLTPDNFV